MKATSEMAAKIRQAYSDEYPWIYIKDIAKRFGIDKAIASRIIRNVRFPDKNWKRPTLDDVFEPKLCIGCGKVKKPTEFYRSKSYGGLSRLCIDCSRKGVRTTEPEPENRRPATGFKYRCRTCGMGYDDEVSAARCCERLPLAAFEGRTPTGRKKWKQREKDRKETRAGYEQKMTMKFASSR